MPQHTRSFQGFYFDIFPNGVRANLPPRIDEENMEDICGAPREEEPSLPYGFSITNPRGTILKKTSGKEYVMGREITSVL